MMVVVVLDVDMQREICSIKECEWKERQPWHLYALFSRFED